MPNRGAPVKCMEDNARRLLKSAVATRAFDEGTSCEQVAACRVSLFCFHEILMSNRQ